MRRFHATQPTEPKLRVDFDDTAFSFGFSPRTSLAEVAGWVADVAHAHNGAPIAIDITLAATGRRINVFAGGCHAAL